jgi:Uncharacterised nucleotidyltransferase
MNSDPRENSAAGRALASIAGFGCPGSREFPDSPLDATAWTTVWARLGTERLVGLAQGAIEAGFPVTGEQRSDVQTAAEAQAIDCFRLEALLVGLARLFADRAIDWRLVKGPSVARRFYPRIEWRPFGDIDVVVRAEHWDAAAGLLTEMGCARRFDEPRPGFTSRFGKGACFVTPDNYEIDLHRTFVAGPHGLRFDPSVLFDEPDRVELFGMTIMTTSPALTAVHVAMHAMLGSPEPRLLPLRDLVQVVGSGVSVDELLATATSLGARLPLARAVVTATSALQVSTDPALTRWASSYRPTPHEQRAFEVYRARDRRYSRQALAGLRALPDWRSRAAYASALALPQRSYLARRRQSLARRAIVSAQLLRGRRAGR